MEIKVQSPPLLQNHAWETPGLHCLQKERLTFCAPWLQAKRNIREQWKTSEGMFFFFRILLRGWFRAYSRECLGQRIQVYEQPWLTDVRVKQSMIIKHNHNTLSRCAGACFRESECCSYEFSPTYLQCNLNKECRPTEKKFRDFLFCKKTKNLTTETNE